MTRKAVSNVLVIDDQAEIRSVLSRVIKDYPDLRVSEAATPETARQLWRKLQPGLIFLDLYLPELDGLKLLAEIKKEAFDTHVIVVTGQHDVETGKEALEAGAWDYIDKPFDVKRVRELVELWMAVA
mgnify:FL=1